MRRIFLSFVAAFAFITAFAQQSYITQPDVAVFIPENFDASQHLPSPIFLRELSPYSALPSTWQLKPTFKSSEGKTIIEINVGDADLYGTGEVWGPLRRNGDKNIFWNRDNGAYGAHAGKMLYQTHPWILGLRKDGTAFGIIYDNTWRSELICDSNIKYISDGPACRVIIIEKDSPEEILKELGKLSGTIEMPPLWSLGYQQCRFSYYPDTRVKEISDEFRARKIPCDVIWMDIHYMDEYRIFTFDKEKFPDPKALNDYLHAKNFKSVYMIDPGAKVDSNYFVDKQLVANDYAVRRADGTIYEGNVWPGACHFPDFTRPEVRSWWASLYKDYMATGIDGVWNDMNEPAVFGGGDEMTMPDDNIHLGGDGLTQGNHVRYHNVYGYNMVKASRAGIMAANPQKRPFVLSRSNFLGGQRYAATWTGDNFSNPEQMKGSIAMTLNMGLSGQPFNGPDIGGFLGNGNPELLAQWTAMGVYFPFTRNHSCDGTLNQEPWAMGSNTEKVCRTAIERRYRLLPYIYTLFHTASTSGLPVMRPVFWADTKDLSLRSEQHTFLLGNDLLVIPRFAEDAKTPKGDWDIIPFEDVDDGFQSIVALRSGAIVPLANLYQNTVEYKTDSLTFLINPDNEGQAKGEMYEDAGEGYGYKHGDYAKYELIAGTEKGQLNFEIRQIEGNRIKNDRKIRIGIVADGKIFYSPWVFSSQIKMKKVKDKNLSFNLQDIKFRPMPNDYNPGDAKDVRIGADQLVK
jgi:alpha-glucosidase